MDSQNRAEMGQNNFPTTHTTSTTANIIDNNIHFDPEYVKSLPGTLKCAEMVLDLLSFICIAVTIRSTSATANWFSFVSMGGFWITLIFTLLFLFHLIEKFNSLPWLLIEWIYCALWAFFYFTAASAAASQGSYDSAMAAAAFFGYASVIVYGFDAYLKYISWRAGDLAQGTNERKNYTNNQANSPVNY